MDHASNALAAVTSTPAFLDAKTPFRLGKAKRHRDALALFRLRPSGTFGFFRMLLFTGFALTTDKLEMLSRISQQATTREFGMKTILAIMGATALLASAASAAPLNPTAAGTPEASNIEQVRLVCNQFGRCWRTRGPRYVYRNYDNGYRSYNYYGGPGYYTGPAYGYYGGGPSFGFSFGTRGW